MNITDELQRLLDMRNVRYRLVKELGKDMFYLDWEDWCGDYTKAICVQGACITAEISYLSPEQAIAITLYGKCGLTDNELEILEDMPALKRLAVKAGLI